MRTLGELIKRLEKEDPGRIVPFGFSRPHSYRGYYDELAFEPKENITIGEMLEAAQSALGKTFMGYKGGEYVMDEFTYVWLSEYGTTGETLGPILLELLLRKP